MEIRNQIPLKGRILHLMKSKEIGSAIDLARAMYNKGIISKTEKRNEKETIAYAARTINTHIEGDGKPFESLSGIWIKNYCDYFNCSADYLLGYIEHPSHDLNTVCEITGLSEKAVEELERIKFLCNPDNVFSPGMGAGITIKGDSGKEEDVTPFKRDEDTSVGRLKYASENRMMLNTINLLVTNRIVLNLLMNYMYFDKINEISVNNTMIVPKLGIVQVNGLMMIGSGALKNGILADLGKKLDEIINTMKNDSERQRLIDLFLG